MEKFLNKPIKEVLTLYPNVGKILQGYDIGCVTCGVGSCLLKDVVLIHDMPEESRVELMYMIEKELYPDRNIAKPVVSAVKKEAVKTRKFSPPIKCLVDEHVNIMRLVKMIPAIIESVDITTPEGRQVILDSVEFIRSYADKFHHMKEEDILFNYCDHNSDIIQAMLKDHDTARGFIRAAVKALDLKDKQGVSSNLIEYSKLLTEHIKKEDEILYPWIDRGLSTSQVGEMFSRFNEKEEKIDNEAIIKCLKFANNIEEIIKQRR